MNQTIADLANTMPHAMLLAVSGFLLSTLLTPVYTYYAYKYKFWKRQRTTSTTGEKLTVFNKLHADKFRRNIPTMAGIVFSLSIIVITSFFNMDMEQTWLPLMALIGGAAVGLLDDIINLHSGGKGVAGLRSSIKFAMITAIGLILGWYFYAGLHIDTINFPYLGDWQIGWWIIPVFAFAVVATGNAVNISDGLDGLAGGLLALSYAAFGVIAALQSQFILAGFCLTVVGALLSYLWFNIYPARFFMGDVGSFALGTALGVVAMQTDSLFILPVIGIIFVAEAGSSAIQILSKKICHRKIFISAPFHQHLQAIGWPETKVTMRFWVIGAVTAMIGVCIAITGGHL